jgi:hypothetical protein
MGRTVTMSGGLIGPEYDAQIRETILAVRGQRRVSTEGDLSGSQRFASRFSEKAVILDAALGVATSSQTGATSALAAIQRWSVTDGEYIETEQQITVWNHSESTAYAADTFGFARFIQGHWCFFGDCAAMAERIPFDDTPPEEPP